MKQPTLHRNDQRWIMVQPKTPHIVVDIIIGIRIIPQGLLDLQSEGQLRISCLQDGPGEFHRLHPCHDYFLHVHTNSPKPLNPCTYTPISMHTNTRDQHELSQLTGAWKTGKTERISGGGGIPSTRKPTTNCLYLTKRKTKQVCCCARMMEILLGDGCDEPLRDDRGELSSQYFSIKLPGDQ